MDLFTIGQLARQADVHIETLRYYERRGLISKPHRTVSNYRLYSSANLRLVKFIKQAQALGFSLKEIEKLLALRAAPRAKCAAVQKYATSKIEEIGAKIRSLARMRKTLEKLLDECSGSRPVTQCPILDSLDSELPIIDQKLNEKKKIFEHKKKSRDL
jgi:Hg(II)-responsive transcriptional regulator